jgi:hypothetical protein
MEENKENDSNSLESTEPTTPSPDAAAGSDSLEGADSASTPAAGSSEPEKPKGGKRSLKETLRHINIYFLGFVFLVVLAATGAGIYYFSTNKKVDNANKIKSSTLSSDSLKQLENTDVTVGDSKQILTVKSNAIFGGSVLLKGDVEVAGKLVVGDQLSLTGINVGGESTLQDAKIANDLSVAHNLAVQGLISAQGGLSVSGNTTFANLSVNSLTVSSLNFSGTWNLTQHIVAGGGTPGRSSGSALGGGGTVGISGSDTAGTININTGGGASAGCFATVNFAKRYDGTPHVVVTPVGSAAAGLAYYVTRNTSGFSVCTASNPPDGASFAFDYIVLG